MAASRRGPAADIPAGIGCPRSVAAFGRNAVVFREDDPVDSLMYLISGTAVVRRTDTKGVPAAIHLATPGSTFGFRDLIANGRHHTVTVQCATDSLFCVLPLAAAERAFATDRALERLFMDDLARQLRSTQERILQMVSLKVGDRLLTLIERMSTIYGAPAGEGAIVLCVPLSRIDMASLAGMTPETLSRTIRDLEADNLAHFTRRRIVVPSLARIRGVLAGLGVESLGSGDRP